MESVDDYHLFTRRHKKTESESQLNCLLVHQRRFELPQIALHAPQACASTVPPLVHFLNANVL